MGPGLVLQQWDQLLGRLIGLSVLACVPQEDRIHILRFLLQFAHNINRHPRCLGSKISTSAAFPGAAQGQCVAGNVAGLAAGPGHRHYPGGE